MPRAPTELRDLPLGPIRVIYRKTRLVVVIQNDGGILADPWGTLVRQTLGDKALRKYWVASMLKSHIEIGDNGQLSLKVPRAVFQAALKVRTFDDFDIPGTCAMQSFQRLGGTKVKRGFEGMMLMRQGLKDEDDPDNDDEDTTVPDVDPRSPRIRV